MLTLRPQANSGRIAIFVSNNPKMNAHSRNIFLTSDNDDNKVIPRGEILKYINPDCFKPGGGRYPIKERDVNIVMEAILHENPIGITHPHLRGVYEAAHSNMIENMKHLFNAEWENGRLFVGPTMRSEQRDYIIASGPAGSGKTYWAADYCQAYDFTHAGKRPIYLVTVKEKCNKFDTLPFVTRVHQSIWPEFMNLEKLQRTYKQKKNDQRTKSRKRKKKDKEDDKEEEEDDDDKPNELVEGDNIDKLQDKKFAKSLFVFDDIENVSEKYLGLLNDFKEYLTEVGRESEIDIIECNHMLMDGMKTRRALSECTAVVTFPGVQPYHVKRYLKEYLAISPSEINKILSDNSRWVMVGKFVPISVVTPTKCWVVKTKVEELD